MPAMNKRIGDLIEQCRGDTYFNGEGYDEYPPDMKKFAESIIQECLEQCQQVSAEHFGAATADSAAASEGPDPHAHGIYTGSIKCRVKIKEHFGMY